MDSLLIRNVKKYENKVKELEEQGELKEALFYKWYLHENIKKLRELGWKRVEGVWQMRERENWDVICEVCDKTIERGVATESGENYCDSCYDKLAYENKVK